MNEGLIPDSDNRSSDERSSDPSLPSVGRLAGIDYGTVRVGVAVCDPGQSICSPLTIYQRRNDKLDRQFFQQLVAEESIVGFVVGLPLHLSGDESEKCRESRAFGRWLEQTTNRPVVWFDERFTTSLAREILNQSHLSGAKRKAQLDKLAAQILLTAFLDSARKLPPETRL